MGREDFDLIGFVEYASFDYYLTIINFSSDGALYFSAVSMTTLHVLVGLTGCDFRGTIPDNVICYLKYSRTLNLMLIMT